MSNYEYYRVILSHPTLTEDMFIDVIAASVNVDAYNTLIVSRFGGSDGALYPFLILAPGEWVACYTINPTSNTPQPFERFREAAVLVENLPE